MYFKVKTRPFPNPDRVPKHNKVINLLSQYKMKIELREHELEHINLGRHVHLQHLHG